MPCWDRYVEMLDVRIRFIERTYLHLVGIADIVVGYLPHLSAHRGGKEPMLHLLRYCLQDLLQISLETHIKHHIRFVEDDDRDLAQLESFAPEQVAESAGSGYYNMVSLGELTDLLLDGSTAVEC